MGPEGRLSPRSDQPTLRRVWDVCHVTGMQVLGGHGMREGGGRGEADGSGAWRGAMGQVSDRGRVAADRVARRYVVRPR